jgi:hypothetical protein
MQKENHKKHPPYNLELMKREAKYWQTELKNLAPELEGMPQKLVNRLIKCIQDTLTEVNENSKQPAKFDYENN